MTCVPGLFVTGCVLPVVGQLPLFRFRVLMPADLRQFFTMVRALGSSLLKLLADQLEKSVSNFRWTHIQTPRCLAVELMLLLVLIVGRPSLYLG